MNKPQLKHSGLILMPIVISSTDTPEVKQAKEALIEAKNDALAEAKNLFEEKGKAKFDIKSDEAQLAIKSIIDEKLKDINIKQGDKDVALKDILKELQDQHNALSTKVNEAKAEDDEKKSKTFVEAVKDAWNEKKSEIDSIIANKGKQSGPLVLDVKAAVTMGDFNTIFAAGSASHYTLTTNTGIISALRKRILTYLQSVSIGMVSVDRPVAMWIEELDEQGNPIFIGEADPKTQLSVRYEEREKRARKIGVYGKVTMEMLRYLPQLISYIQNNLVKRMDIKTEDQLFNGDDTGNNLKGIIPYSTAFNGGSGPGGSGISGQVDNANIYDIIRAVALQVQNNFGTPTALFVKTDVAALMDVTKSVTAGEYMVPAWSQNGNRIVAGMEIIPTAALNGTGFDFVGGDLSVVHVGFTDNATIQIGLDGNDFTNNLKTILVEQELVQFVSANDTQVLVKGTIAAAKTILETT